MPAQRGNEHDQKSVLANALNAFDLIFNGQACGYEEFKESEEWKHRSFAASENLFNVPHKDHGDARRCWAVGAGLS